MNAVDRKKVISVARKTTAMGLVCWALVVWFVEHTDPSKNN